MFAKLAQFHMFSRSRRRSMAVTAAYANDNLPVRRLAAFAQRPPRRALICHWHHVAPRGALECIWHIEGAKASAVEEPGISRLAGQGQRFLCRALADRKESALAA